MVLDLHGQVGGQLARPVGEPGRVLDVGRRRGEEPRAGRCLGGDPRGAELVSGTRVTEQDQPAGRRLARARCLGEPRAAVGGEPVPLEERREGGIVPAGDDRGGHRVQPGDGAAHRRAGDAHRRGTAVSHPDDHQPGRQRLPAEALARQRAGQVEDRALAGAPGQRAPGGEVDEVDPVPRRGVRGAGARFDAVLTGAGRGDGDDHGLDQVAVQPPTVSGEGPLLAEDLGQLGEAELTQGRHPVVRARPRSAPH